VREEVGEHRELVAWRARRGEDLEQFVAAAVPVAPVTVLDGRPHAQRLAPDDLDCLLRTRVAFLVGVVGEGDRRPAWDECCPFALEGRKTLIFPATASARRTP
jgi:hypothetical protein